MQQKGQFANAVIDFRMALEADSSAAILHALGESYKRIARNRLAIDAYQKAIALEPEYVEPLESLAEVLMYEGEMEEALKVMEKAYDIDPSDERKYMLASIYEYVDKKKALELYAELTEEDDVSPYVVSKVLNLYKELGEEDLYLEQLLKIYDKNAGNLTYAQDILEEYYVRKEYDEGVGFLKEIEKDFTPAEHLELSITYGDNLYRSELPEDSGVESLFMDYIERNEDKGWRLLYLGGLLAGKKEDMNRAQYFFDKVIEQADTLQDIPLQIGLFYLDSDLNERALEIFNEYTAQYPEDGRYPFFSGIVYSEMDETELAEKSYLKAYRIDTTNVDVITNLGLLYDRKGDVEKTKYFYEKGYNIDPDNPLLNNNYAYHLAVTGGNLDKAERMSRYALSRDPENISYLDTYGWIHYKLGNYNLALENLEKALELGEPSAEVLEHLGDVYMALDRQSEALSTYRRSLELDPERPGLMKKISEIN